MTRPKRRPPSTAGVPEVLAETGERFVDLAARRLREQAGAQGGDAEQNVPVKNAIEYGNARAEVVPSLGSGLARLDLMRDGAAVPILRPWPGGSTHDPRASTELSLGGRIESGETERVEIVVAQRLLDRRVA